jgi:lipoyl(octanoyl) transferase
MARARSINLNNRKKDIRKFINIIENSIILSLQSFGIRTYSDRKNIGIWTKLNNKDRKVGAIGIKVKKWIAYHGFSININNDISNYKKIIPCGIKDKGITTLKKIDNQNYNKLSKEIIKNLLTNLKI